MQSFVTPIIRRELTKGFAITKPCFVIASCNCMFLVTFWLILRTFAYFYEVKIRKSMQKYAKSAYCRFITHTIVSLSFFAYKAVAITYKALQSLYKALLTKQSFVQNLSEQGNSQDLQNIQKIRQK